MPVTDSVVLRLYGLQNHKNGSAQVSASVSILESVEDQYWRTLRRIEVKSVGGYLCGSVFVTLETRKSQNDEVHYGYPLADPLADHCNLPGLLHSLTDTSADWVPLTSGDVLTDEHVYWHQIRWRIGWRTCWRTRWLTRIRRRTPWRILWRTQNPLKKWNPRF